MKVTEIMSQDVAVCTPETPLPEIARMMVDCDCGEIPVVDSRQDRRPVGVVTDRDIVCRIVAEGRNPLQLTAEDCMSSPVITAQEETSVGECLRLLEEHQIRRIPVVDPRGSICGIVALADVALQVPKERTGKVVKEVSRRAQEAVSHS